jgi:hypothetical protein
MDPVPGNVLVSQGTEHEPGRVTAADGQDETAPRADGLTSLGGDDHGRPPGDGIGVGEYFHLHKILSFG